MLRHSWYVAESCTFRRYHFRALWILSAVGVFDSVRGLLLPFVLDEPRYLASVYTCLSESARRRDSPVSPSVVVLLSSPSLCASAENEKKGQEKGGERKVQRKRVREREIEIYGCFCFWRGRTLCVRYGSPACTFDA